MNVKNLLSTSEPMTLGRRADHWPLHQPLTIIHDDIHGNSTLRGGTCVDVPPTGSASSQSPCACVTLRSPVDGRVLRILQKSETIVSPGAPLMEVGDPKDLEIVADMLSYDAVKIRPGQQVIIDSWGGNEVLLALVRMVEPFAFTKTSALGIEEQRVNVVMDFLDEPADDVSLGHGFGVNVRVVMWQSDAVKTIPLAALCRHENGWAVYVDTDGTTNAPHRPCSIPIHEPRN